MCTEEIMYDILEIWILQQQWLEHNSNSMKRDLRFYQTSIDVLLRELCLDRQKETKGVSVSISTYLDGGSR